MLYPQYLENYHVLFCAEDPGRGPAWEYGWSNWKAGKGEVQCSYGYRGRYGFARTPRASLRMASIERQPERVLGCDFYEPFFAPPRVHHRDYINVLRCSGQVEPFDKIVSFGPTAADCARAISRLER